MSLKLMQKVQRQERLSNELKLIQKSQEEHPFWKVIQTSDKSWKVQINCDATYPYNGPPFHLLITFPQNYPYGNATITVMEKEKVFHPNINFNNGNICQTVVKQQDLTLTIQDRINEFMVFLKQPNPNSALNGDAATLYIKDPKQYHRQALCKYRGIQLKN